MHPTINTITATLITDPSSPTTCRTCSARFRRPTALLTSKPATKGSNTTSSIDWNKAPASIGRYFPAKHLVSSGVSPMATKVEHIVISTLSATLARAR